VLEQPLPNRVEDIARSRSCSAAPKLFSERLGRDDPRSTTTTAARHRYATRTRSFAYRRLASSQRYEEIRNIAPQTGNRPRACRREPRGDFASSAKIYQVDAGAAGRPIDAWRRLLGVDPRAARPWPRSRTCSARGSGWVEVNRREDGPRSGLRGPAGENARTSRSRRSGHQVNDKDKGTPAYEKDLELTGPTIRPPSRSSPPRRGERKRAVIELYSRARHARRGEKQAGPLLRKVAKVSKSSSNDTAQRRTLVTAFSSTSPPWRSSGTSSGCRMATNDGPSWCDRQTRASPADGSAQKIR